MWGSVMPECPTFAVKLGKLGKWAKWAKCALGTLKGSTVFGAEALGREPAKRLHGSGAGWLSQEAHNTKHTQAHSTVTH